MKPISFFTIIGILLLLQSCYKEPIANFEYSYTDNMAPADITFTNLSTEADKFQWDFGDGTSSSEKNPEHAFYNYVNPSVSLVAKGRGGENRISKNLDITSYFVRNASSYTLYNVVSFFWDGAEIVDDFDLSTLYSGADSEVVITTHMVIDVAFEFSDGTMYLVEYSYTLNEHASSYLNINDETSIVEVPDSKKGTLSKPDIQMIREHGKRFLLQEIMARP